MIAEELWIVRGRQPVLWTIPCYVTWETKEWGMLYFGLALYSVQRKAIEALLDVSSAGRDRGMWRISRTVLEKIGELTTGGNPEHWFSWESPRREAASNPDPQSRSDRDEFLDALYQYGIGNSRSELEFYWHQFCNHALDWLINKEKPVDMYFLALHNCPYRQNWRQVVLGRFPKLGRLLCHKRGVDRDIVINQTGLDDALVNLDLLALQKKTGLAYRHIEVEHKRRWWKTSLRVEQARMARLGSPGYAAYLLRSVKTRMAATLRIYVEYLEGVARPSAADVDCGYRGEFRLVPNVPTPRDLGIRPHQSVLVPTVVPNSAPEYGTPSQPESLYPSNGKLPKVPTIQQAKKNVWNGRPGLHKSPGQSDRAKARLLVLSAGQKLATSELLGMEFDAGPEGMAEGTKLETK